ncbi:MAG: HRDC domain-containing protein [Planctomycetes bacterium]|nr:HRDC domain-containing protein [Planctomycetota bacterium]
MNEKRSSRRAPSRAPSASKLLSDCAACAARAVLGVVCGLEPTSPAAASVPRRRLRNFLRGSESPSPSGGEEIEGAVRGAFGIFWAASAAWVDEIVDRLVEEGHLEVSPDAGTRVSITAMGREVLARGGEVSPRILPRRPQLGSHPQVEERLREIRRRIARESERPAFGIFSNSTLAHIAEMEPRTLAQLAEIPGLGEAKIRKYGRRILAAVRSS